MLINISYGFYQIAKKIGCFFFLLYFPNSHIENHRQNAHFRNFSQIIITLGKDIHCSNTLDEFGYGGSASINMHIMDRLMSRPLLAFLDSFFKLKSPNLVQTQG